MRTDSDSPEGRRSGRFGLPGGGSVVGWVVVAIGAAGVASALSRLAWLSWVVCGLFVISTFGLVMDLVVLLGTGTLDSWPTFLVKLIGAAGAVLFARAALSASRAARRVCVRCGHDHLAPSTGPLRFPDPTAAPRAVRWVAYVGAVTFLPYIAMKTIWAVGGRFAGLEGPTLDDGTGLMSVLAVVGIDLTAALGALAVFLVLALTRPWSQVWPRWVLGLAGRRVPRWLPLTPAFLGAATLGPYGALGAIFMISTGGVGPDASILVGVVGMVAFGGCGLALGVTGLSYLRRTTPICATERRPGAPAPSAPAVRAP